MGILHDLFFGPSSTDRFGDDEKIREDKDWIPAEPIDSIRASDHIADSNDERDIYRDDRGVKLRPEVEIVHLKANLSNESKNIEIWATIKNISEFTTELTRVNFLGQHTSPMRHLRPGESHELSIYRGQTPTNNSFRMADIQYKIAENGDYFQADHYIVYKYEQAAQGSFYVPEECKISLPVKDI